MNLSTDLNEHFKPSDDSDLLINAINAEDFGFKANTCMLQKSNKKYGEGKNCSQESELFMLDQNVAQTNKFGDMSNEKFVKALEHAQQWQKKYIKSEDILDTEIPENHDFRNIQGYDFTGEILN